MGGRKELFAIFNVGNTVAFLWILIIILLLHLAGGRSVACTCTGRWRMVRIAWQPIKQRVGKQLFVYLYQMTGNNDYH